MTRGDLVQHSFARRLKELRDIAKLTQEQLADELGVSRGSVSYYERSDRVPDILFLDRVSQYFGVSIRYLIGDSENAFEQNVDIGLRLNLSDEAIKNWELGEYGYILSALIEDSMFIYFMHICEDFLADDSFRCDIDKRIKRTRSGTERFRMFEISEIFIGLLSGLKAEQNEEISDEQREGNQKRYEQAIVKAKELEVIRESQWAEFSEQYKNEHLIQYAARKKISEALLPKKEGPSTV